MKRQLTGRLAPAALLFSLVAAPALAQNDAPAAPAQAPAAAGTESQAHPPAQTPRGRRLQSHVEQRISDLHTRLKITPAEEPNWNAFAETMRQNADHMDQLMQQRAASQGKRNALDDMRSYAEMAQAHAEDMQRLVPAFEKLYDSLSPEQKQIADQTFTRYERQEARGGQRQ